MQERFPGFDELPREVPKAAERSIKPFDPTYAGQTKAREAHMCDFCGRAIAAGEIYYLEHKNRFPTRSWRRGRKCCRRCYQGAAVGGGDVAG
jgi:hypothetical protein